MIRVGDLKIGNAERKAINDVLDSGRISEGEKVRQFEQEWAKYLGAKYCVLVNSGTSALICALTVLKELTEHHQVITTPLTFIATINAIKLSGFYPIFVDIKMDTFGMDEIKANDYSKNGIVMPVHLMGYPADIDLLNQKYIIEDACQAHGSIYKGRKVGTIGLMGCFSFYIAHNIQVGEMGAVVTNDEGCYKLLKQIKAHGRECTCPICHRPTCPHKDHDPRFTHTLVGYNFKTSEFNASLGLCQLKRIDKIIKARQKNVWLLNKGLKDIKQLRLPIFSDKVSYIAYPLLLLSGSRNAFCKRLEENGIETRPLFGCVPTQQPAYDYLKNSYKYKLPNAEFVGEQGFYIGCHQYLTTKDINRIIKTFKDIL